MAVIFGALVFVGIIGLVMFFLGISIYNNLVALNKEIDRSWANIDVILKQRFDEIPQLVQVIEQSAKFEAGLIKQVTDARTRYGQASTINEKVQAANEMSFALKGIFAIGENYPDLKTNQNFTQLQTRVSDLENSISDRRENYNSSVTNYNIRIHQIPDVIFAKILGYRDRDLYKIAAEETTRPNLKMNLPFN